jgi:hypothetical protein
MRTALRLARVRRLVPLLVPLLCLACAGPRGSATDADTQRVVDLLTGTFSSAAQAAAAAAAVEDPTEAAYFDIRLVHAPIWTDRDDGPWLYVEQAVAARPDRPYRQRVYRVRAEGDAVRSDVFVLPDGGADLVNAWRDPARFDGLTPDDLEPRAGCTVFLRRSGEGFVGSAHDRDCASDFQGATHTTSIVEVDADGIRSWDRGWDDAGAQVWGAVDGPYRFDRVADAR